MIFFSSLAYPVRQIVLGQYIGIGSLVAIGVLGSLIALVVPTYVIGLLGIVPIAIGIKNLIEIRKKDKSITRQVVQHEKNKSYLFLFYRLIILQKCLLYITNVVIFPCCSMNPKCYYRCWKFGYCY